MRSLVDMGWYGLDDIRINGVPLHRTSVEMFDVMQSLCDELMTDIEALGELEGDRDEVRLALEEARSHREMMAEQIESRLFTLEMYKG